MLNKEFIRFLKDIGLYSAYTSDKGSTGKEYDFFSDFINCSFCWADTKHEHLWETLFETAICAEAHFDLRKRNINTIDKYKDFFKQKLF